jgi:hypothetical protein
MKPAADGRIPLRLVIVTVVVGLLFVTCGALLGFVLHREPGRRRRPDSRARRDRQHHVAGLALHAARRER